MIVHITVFVFVIIIAGIAEYFREKNRTMAYLAILSISFILIFISSIRYWVGTDYAQYFYSYSAFAKNVVRAIKELDEPGLNVLSWLSEKTIGNFSGMFFYMSLVTILFCCYSIYKYSTNYLYSFFLYITAGCWMLSFNAVRQCAAIALLLFGVRYIYERKFWKYLFIVLIAFLFHRSAIVFILLYFVLDKKVDPKTIISLVVVGVFLMLGGGLIIRFIGTNIDRYTVENLERNVYVLQRVNSLRVLVAVVPVIIAYFIYGLRGLNENEDRAFSFNILLLNAVLAIGTSGSAYLARFALYTNIFIPKLYLLLFP